MTYMSDQMTCLSLTLTDNNIAAVTANCRFKRVIFRTLKNSHNETSQIG